MSYNYATRTLPFKYHKERIIHELMEAGVTAYGLLKAESRYLPHIINEYEHIQAVIYGQHHNSSAMLVATTERIIYLDKKPMAGYIDEISYEVVSGIKFDVHTFFAKVTLHSAVANYDFSFVNLNCAHKFTQFIEEKRMEHKDSGTISEGEMHKELVSFLPGFRHWVREEE
jgi:hypothetical protein